MQLKYRIIKSVTVGFMVFLLGFASMNIWWNVLPRNAELHGLYYYKAATWGDGICLPLLTGALYYICKYVRKSDNKKRYSIIGVFTVVQRIYIENQIEKKNREINKIVNK